MYVIYICSTCTCVCVCTNACKKIYVRVCVYLYCIPIYAHTCVYAYAC